MAADTGGGAPRPTVYGTPAGYNRCKADLIGRLDGSVLEIGAGRGANFGLLPAHVRWIGLEPRHRIAERLRQSSPAGATVLDAPAESIPLESASVDAVLATVVLCSVRSQAYALTEIRRVLRPGGRFVFFEHVPDPPGSLTRIAQRACAPLSRLFDRGCHPGRDTWWALERAGFTDLRYDWYDLGRRNFPQRLYIAGVAVR